jgi:hypothetical protein
MGDSFYGRGLRFECQRCSGCCRHDPGFVHLSESDLARLIAWSGLARESFIKAYCRWVPRGDGQETLCLLEKPGYDCVLWDGGCVAYEQRPLQCSTYPFWPSLLCDEDWWDANARDCPGIGKGPLHPLEEIDACLEARRREPYIKRPAQERE